MTETTRLWIAAANILAENPQAIVNCPECKVGTLKTEDVSIEMWDKIDRWMYCEACGKYNVLTMTKREQ